MVLGDAERLYECLDGGSACQLSVKIFDLCRLSVNPS